MEGYSRVFDHAIQKFTLVNDTDSLFESFRSNFEVYGFIDNGDRPLDVEADSIARKTNLELYTMYKSILKGRTQVGYARSSSNYADYSNLDSRHIMMSVLLFSNLKQELDSVVEIGGGFGNWLFLNQNQSFKKWTIIDLPHVLKLQKWYLDKQTIDPLRYTQLSAFDDSEWKSGDLVIGSHSLSEFSFDIFYKYFDKIISKSKYFFYCYHNTMPTPQLINTKLMVINSKFNLLFNVQSENGNVSNCLFVTKSI